MDKLFLFLDYDGVLHPDAVYQTRRGLELRASGQLLMHASVLEEILDEFPQAKIVLSTSWVVFFHSAERVGCSPNPYDLVSLVQPGTLKCLERPSTVTTYKRVTSKYAQRQHARG